MQSTSAFGRVEQFHLESTLDVGRVVQRPAVAGPLFEKRPERAGATPTEAFVHTISCFERNSVCLKATSPCLSEVVLWQF